MATVCSCCLAMMGWTPAFVPVLVLFLMTTALDAHTVPTEMAFATNTLPRAYWARMQSLRVAGFQILSGLGSFFTGAIIVQYGYWLPFLLAGLAQIVSVLLDQLEQLQPLDEYSKASECQDEWAINV